MENTILINEINKKDNEKIYDLISQYLDAKQAIELNQAKIESIEKVLNDIEYKSVGVQELNVRVTITKAKQQEVIDYKATISNLPNKEDYLTKEFKVVEDKEKIEKELKDKLVKDFKTTKTVIRLTALDKDL